MKKVLKYCITGICFFCLLHLCGAKIENIYAENTESTDSYSKTAISFRIKSKWKQIDLIPLLPDPELNRYKQQKWENKERTEGSGKGDKFGTQEVVLKVKLACICILSALEIVLVIDCMGSCFFTYRKGQYNNTKKRKIPYSFAMVTLGRLIVDETDDDAVDETLGERIAETVDKTDDETLGEIIAKTVDITVNENKVSNIVSINKRRMHSKKFLELPPIVVQAEHICMDFDKEVNEYSSMKELMIKTIKGERKKEKYQALDDISFTIRRGEVIGVVGTNGAGKSTLLKIIAKALIPTSGSINVNRDKIQILTLGTGFDMELTGRENVYLNGAIIGYEKKFIDEHYDQIVEFAELKDFMEEKVKNYSSGMVSRLGFAIATVGDAAEILLLDEVLSVGDRVFQEKSMKRIKEMIHGGSTVIMVSHSIKTIRENCDKVFWIEKGRMILSGDARFICNTYEKYDGNIEKLTFSESKKNRKERVKDWLNLKITGKG